MSIASIFYGIGIFFIFVTIIYFFGTYLENIPSTTKAIISLILSFALFFLGVYLEKEDL
jgi:hypothetical protein